MVLLLMKGVNLCYIFFNCAFSQIYLELALRLLSNASSLLLSFSCQTLLHARIKIKCNNYTLLSEVIFDCTFYYHILLFSYDV
jgi:hypothetical protein